MNRPHQQSQSGCCHSSPAASIDPVCGMTVEAGSPHQAEHDGQHFGFCSAACRAKFVNDPMRYSAGTSKAHGLGLHAQQRPLSTTQAKAPASPQAEAPPGTIYTCPMHPEVRQIGPGHCPKCGMALEPLMPTETTDDSEIRGVR